MPFDLLDWYRFRPATEMCQNCRAIYLPLIPIDERENLRWKIQRGLVKECRVCGVVIAREDQGDLVMKRQKEQAANLRELAAVAESLPPHTDPEALTVEPLASLFKAINAANWFIHFTSFSIDSTILGALRMASQRVQVRGIVGKLNNFDRKALEALQGLDVKDPTNPFTLLADSTETPLVDGMHVKLLIVDGVLALKGSANLTVAGYVKAGKMSGTDAVEAVSIPDEVIRLNNSYFARHWGQSTPVLDAESFLPF